MEGDLRYGSGSVWPRMRKISKGVKVVDSALKSIERKE